LIANRGEIALRVISSARATAIAGGVYSPTDAGARPRQEADQAVGIGETFACSM